MRCATRDAPLSTRADASGNTDKLGYWGSDDPVRQELVDKRFSPRSASVLGTMRAKASHFTRLRSVRDLRILRCHLTGAGNRCRLEGRRVPR